MTRFRFIRIHPGRQFQSQNYTVISGLVAGPSSLLIIYRRQKKLKNEFFELFALDVTPVKCRWYTQTPFTNKVDFLSHQRKREKNTTSQTIFFFLRSKRDVNALNKSKRIFVQRRSTFYRHLRRQTTINTFVSVDLNFHVNPECSPTSSRHCFSSRRYIYNVILHASQSSCRAHARSRLRANDS